MFITQVELSGDHSVGSVMFYRSVISRVETLLAMGEGELCGTKGNKGITVFWYTKSYHPRGEIAYSYVFPSFKKLSDITYYLWNFTRTSLQ